jgi:IclR family acetate operon transcriptional repressor
MLILTPRWSPGPSERGFSPDAQARLFFDDEEHALGLRCVASCIYDEHREPFAAISISGPISRMTDDRVTELGALVIKAAKEVTLAYGGMR